MVKRRNLIQNNMTKKKKIKKLPELPRQAVYPYRVGQEVYAIIWEDELFAYGKIVSSCAVTTLNEPGSECHYDIECDNGEYFCCVPERAVFLTSDDLAGEITLQLMVSNMKIEEED